MKRGALLSTNISTSKGSRKPIPNELFWYLLSLGLRHSFYLLAKRWQGSFQKSYLLLKELASYLSKKRFLRVTSVPKMITLGPVTCWLLNVYAIVILNPLLTLYLLEAFPVVIYDSLARSRDFHRTREQMGSSILFTFLRELSNFLPDGKCLEVKMKRI